MKFAASYYYYCLVLLVTMAMSPVISSPFDNNPDKPSLNEEQFEALVHMMQSTDPDQGSNQITEAAAKTPCATHLYLMGFTSGLKDAESDTSHSIGLFVSPNEHEYESIPNNPNVDDMTQNKGDLWTLPISQFGFKKSCIWKDDIDKVVIVNGGNGGWNIGSVTTMISENNKTFALLTADMGVNHWVDGDQGCAEYQFILTKV